MSENKNELEVKYEIDGNPIRLTFDIVQKFIVGNQANISLPEYKFFTELCKVRKLNPFMKEAYLIKYSDNDPAQLVVAKDAILKTAIKNPQYDGREQGIIVQLKDGTIDFRKGTFKLADEKLVGGWAKVYRKDISHPTEITVSFDEVAQRKRNGELNANWSKKGATMVEKVALCRALRETFVEDCGGMVDADEVWNNDDLADNKTVHKASDSNTNELSMKYAKLRSQLNACGYDFRNEENDEYIRMYAEVQTQDITSLNNSDLKRLCSVYERLVEEHGNKSN